ncbi:hypothetical protein RISK_001777 [Rhodopirellula islandica]|uniref:Uncharacterized protein n=1 Tax=Rhodopirellula islandica TaxID=595434 RepID=A0A0J1BHB3_RHOIS|nr:hypothetical protein RISK_001777 [Rhodopirellula islandica]
MVPVATRSEGARGERWECGCVLPLLWEMCFFCDCEGLLLELGVLGTGDFGAASVIELG